MNVTPYPSPHYLKYPATRPPSSLFSPSKDSFSILFNPEEGREKRKEWEKWEGKKKERRIEKWERKREREKRKRRRRTPLNHGNYVFAPGYV